MTERIMAAAAVAAAVAVGAVAEAVVVLVLVLVVLVLVLVAVDAVYNQRRLLRLTQPAVRFDANLWCTICCTNPEKC